MQIALTHSVSPSIGRCELSFVERKPINYEMAVKQHEHYCAALSNCGIKVIELSVNRSYPDSTFIEDTAVVVDEIAIMASMGVDSRRGEIRGIELELAKYREIARIQPPATLEGGDVLLVGKQVFVGLTPRTNQAGVDSLRTVLEPFGYQISSVAVRDCLHLKSACTAINNHTLLVNPHWIELKPFRDFRIITVPEQEPWAANSLHINHTTYLHAGFSKMVTLLRSLGFSVKTINISELLKAEAGLTCSSIRFKHDV